MIPDTIYIERPGVTKSLSKALDDPGIRVVWLFGQIGQGKTVELKRLIDQNKHMAACAYAACSSPLGGEPTTSLKPYQPLKDIFEDLLQNQSAAQRNLKLLKNVSLTILACIPVVGDLAYGVKEIRRDLDEYKRGVRTVDFEKFEDDCYHALLDMAQEEPVVLVIDDFQWADRQTIQALHRFITDEAFKAHRITLMLSCRQDELTATPEVLSFHSAFSRTESARELELPPFTAGQIRDYLKQWFTGTVPDDLLVAWLLQKTGGNPMFVRSYINYLLSEGILDTRGIVTGNLQNFSGLPAEVKTINAWLMKSLPESDMELLLTASVLGFEFSLHELSNLTQRPALDLIRHLRSISATHGVVETVGFKLWNGKESTVYRFTQHAIHSALYNELTAEEREALHRMAAFYLNDLRHVVQEPALINSIAQPLLVHAHLGKQPELEYDSILMKARSANENVDMEHMQERFSSLSPLLGLSVNEMQEAYGKALAVSRLAAADIPGGGAPIEGFLTAGNESVAGGLGSLIAELLTRLGEHKHTAVLQKTRLYLDEQKRIGSVPHPLVLIVHGIALVRTGSSLSEARRILAEAAGSSVSSTWALVAKFAHALFAPRDEWDAALADLQNSAHDAVVRDTPVGAMVLALVHLRFDGDVEARNAFLMHPQVARLMELSNQDRTDYPKTYAALDQMRS